MADANNIVFEDRFTVDDVDRDGKRFDRVSRINARSHNLSMTLTLDIANELYPLAASETFALAVARSLVPDEQDTGSVDGDADGDGAAPKKVKRELWRSGDQGLASDYEYVMYGKIYKFDDSAQGDNQTCVVYFTLLKETTGRKGPCIWRIS